MTIFIRTSGGGGIVLLVALALIFGHGSGISGVVTAVLLAWSSPWCSPSPSRRP